MKFIGPELGRHVLLFPWEEVRPIHGLGIQMIVGALSDRYKFSSSPNLNRPWKEIENSILEFRDGVFVGPQSPTTIYGLDLYSDGLGVQCRITDDAELVMSDLISWAQKSVGLRPFIREPRKIYLSNIVVEFETPISNLFTKWDQLQKMFSAAIESNYGIKEAVSSQRLSWKCDPMKVVNANLMSEFVIDRRNNEPHEANRFHCSLPLPTSQAVAFLEQLEILVR